MSNKESYCCLCAYVESKKHCDCNCHLYTGKTHTPSDLDKSNQKKTLSAKRKMMMDLVKEIMKEKEKEK